MKALVQIQDARLAKGVSITGLQFQLDLTGQVETSMGLADVRGVAQRVAQRIQDSAKEILEDEVVKEYGRLTDGSYSEELAELDSLLQEAQRIQQELSQEQAQLTERRKLLVETDKAVKSYVEVLVKQTESPIGETREASVFQDFLAKAMGAKR